MSIDRVITGIDTVGERWRELERDWQSVVIGVVIVALIFVFELRIPW